MSRRLIALAIAATATAAHAQPAPDATAPAQPAPDASAPAQPAPDASAPAAPDAELAEEQVGDQGISAVLGLATGGRATPGGLRIAGHYFYQLAEEDWFDGAASFTFGSGGAACFRDRADQLVCDHGLADGAGFELSASVRRMFAPRGAFHPFAHLGIGLGVVRFDDDDVTGFTIPAHGGAGIRVQVAPAIAVVVDADLALGFGSFSRGLGTDLQFGFAITAGVEFRLR